MSIEDVLVDFQFYGAKVDYDPDPGKVFLMFDKPGVTFSAKDGGVAPPPRESYSAADGLRGGLFLDVDDFGDLVRVSFNTFGSLPPVEDQSLAVLVRSSAQAMGGTSLQFIVDSTSLPGPLASRFRDAGIFTTVAGLSLEVWLPPYTDSPRRVNRDFLTAASDIAGGSLMPATPIPSTILLFLAAAIPLIGARRRA